MNKKTMAKVLGVAMAACLTGGVVGLHNVASADDSTVVTNAEWITPYGGSATYDTATGASTLTMTTWGQRAYYAHKVKLDGLTVTVGATAQVAKKTFGFGFTNVASKYTLQEVSTVNVVWAPALYNADNGPTNRIFVSKTHDYGSKATVCYTDSALTSQGTDGKVFGLDTSYVIYQSADDAYSFTFDLVTAGPDANDDVYSVTIGVVRGGDVLGGQNSTVYFSEADMAGMLDENGECYISTWGMEGNHVFTMDIDDDNTKAYEAGALATATAALTAYETAAQEAVNDANKFADALAAKDTLTAAIANLRGNDKIDFNADMVAIDETLSGNQDGVKATIQAEYDEAATAIAALATEAGINAENITAAKEALDAANAKYAEMKAMLDSTNQAYFEELAADHSYDIQLAEVKLWVIGWETQVAGLDGLTADELIAAIVEAKEDRAAYVGSREETIVTSVLTADDKQAIEARIAAADEDLTTIENANLNDVKQSYLAELESKIDDEDLTIGGNVDEAKSAYANLLANVTIEEADGELYTRLNTAYATLKDAAEAYVEAEIGAVKTALESEITTLSAFKEVKTRWDAVSIDYLLEENATIAAAYDEVNAAIGDSDFYYINTHGDDVSDVEKTDAGLYFTELGQHPQRLNYNKALDLSEGVTVKIQLTEMAFINTDMKAANNLCFNFLSSPDAYKSISDGITVMIWLFSGNSNVKIYTRTSENQDVGSFTIPTPIDGTELTISVKYDANYLWILEGTTSPAYIFDINGSKTVIKAELIREEGASEDMTTCYFSAGSYMDNRDGVDRAPNCYTLVSVNDVSFAVVESTPDDGNGGGQTPDDGNGGGQTPDGGNDDNADNTSGGCGNVIGGAGIAVSVAMAGVALVARKRKED